jgi:hypothetical protein
MERILASDDVVFTDIDIRYLDGSEDPFTIDSERGDTYDIGADLICLAFGKRDHVESELVEINRAVVAKVSKRRRVILRERWNEILEEQARIDAEMASMNADEQQEK